MPFIAHTKNRILVPNSLQIDYNRPYAQSLLGVFVPKPGGFYDLINRTFNTTNEATFDDNRIQFASLQSTIHAGNYDLINASGYSIVVVFDLISVINFSALAGKATSTTSDGYELRLGEGDDESSILMHRANGSGYRQWTQSGNEFFSGSYDNFLGVTCTDNLIETAPTYCVNGEIIVADSQINSGTGAASGTSQSLYLGGRQHGSTGINGAIKLLALYDTHVDPLYLQELNDNPNQILKSRNKTFFIAGAGETSANLTGVASSTSLGSFVVDIAIPLTGVSATGALGSMTVSLDVILTGVSATGAVGTLVVGTSEIAAELTGVSATGALGSLTPSNDQDLTGVVATTALGIITFQGQDLDLELTGVLATASLGTLDNSFDKTLVGQVVTTALGTLVATQEKVANLTGVTATVSLGNLSNAIDIDLTGEQITSAIGNLDNAFDKALLGELMTMGQGDLANTLDITLTGLSSPMATGIIMRAGSPDVTIELTGIQMLMLQGSVNTGAGLKRLSLTRLSTLSLVTTDLTIDDL